MILVDTSVWIAHFRKAGSRLGESLSEGLVMAHPFVLGELACGNLKHRARILSDLEALPSAVSATHEEVMRLIEEPEAVEPGHWLDRCASAGFRAAFELPVLDAGWKT